jgi:hypothetical protein
MRQKSSSGPPLQIAGHRLPSGTAVGNFHVKEISKHTITLERVDGFQPKLFPAP